MLTIGRFQANYRVPDRTPERGALRRRLDGLVRDRLPREMRGRFEPPAADADALYRIRHLRVDVWFDILSMDDREIAGRWGALVLGALSRALASGSAEVVRYDDPPHFVASFLGDLLAGRAWSRWVYEEFLPLRGLPTGRIAATLLAPRPEWLGPVAGRLGSRGQLEPLLRELRPDDIATIWTRGLGFADLPAAPTIEGLAPLLEELAALPVPLVRGGAGRAELAAFRLFLRAVEHRPERVRQRELAAVCRHLALLRALAAAAPASPLWAALADPEAPTPTAHLAAVAGPAVEVAAAVGWLREARATPAGRRYVAALVQTPTAARAAAEATAGATAEASVLVLHTPFAGLALLLPAIRDLGLHEIVGSAGLYQLLLLLVGTAQAPLAIADPAIPRLGGVPFHEAERARETAVPWLDAPGTETEAEIDDVLGPPPAGAVAHRVLMRFARGLRGFADSSPAFLLERFVHLPGRVELADDRVEVWLERSPLGIVLKMASRDGDQGPIPWLDDRPLAIHLPDG